MPFTNEPIVTPEGVTYTPWTDGWAVGFKAEHKDGRVEYVYLNPSGEMDEEGSAPGSVFVYTGKAGDPSEDSAWHHYDMFTEEADA